MSIEISSLEPKAIWENFYNLTQIPRPSKHEEAVVAFIVEFAQNLGLETIKDAIGNVIIKKPATPGRENCKGIILQGHLDMVPQKNSNTTHNFETDPITTYIEGEWVTAKETTLGADNGIGVAIAMAVLQDKNIEHGPIECLFTVDEETGMTGAFGLKPGLLDGDILLNLDSEDEGEVFIGCAGGVNVLSTFNCETEAVPANSTALKLALTGLKGGHSGCDIHLGRGNANKLMNRLLIAGVDQCGLRLAEIKGGSLRNAIPRESFATVVIPTDKLPEFKTMISEYEQIFNAELSAAEPDLSLQCSESDLPASVIKSACQTNISQAISACINGVIRMSDDMKGLVETSSNLASVISSQDTITIECLVRSSIETAKNDSAESIKNVFTLAGASANINGSYPGWKPNMDSPILAIICEEYQKKYGEQPKITAIHAGLECGLLGAVYPNLDMVSFGPTICFPHSPDEKVHIDSVRKTWDFLLDILKSDRL
jgi:dipeptidase D